ncbi:MAG: hypothetical protein HY901_08915, partial [Deltaproteobacteria bacterium]|nr:hypothetical protein [Deltaproteobacteria bacterium]
MAADRRSAILVCVHLSLTGCAVPTLDLTGKACDAAHPCVAGFECVSGSCVSSAATDGGSLECDAGLGACTPSTTQACGTDIGECQAGSQTCSSDGQWGTCVGSVGPAGEVCDGKDNDCNGGTDEWQSLSTSLCPLQLGVCAGSIQSCWAGEEQPCDEFSYGESYEADRERSCDALDNDCDGQTDEGLDDDADGWGVVVRCTA